MPTQKKMRSKKKASSGRLRSRRGSRSGATSPKLATTRKDAARRGKKAKKVASKAAGNAGKVAARRRASRGAGRAAALLRTTSTGAVAAAAETRTAAELARHVLGLVPRIELADQHPSGAVDAATAFRNIEHTALGGRATRGFPGGGVDGLVDLQPSMLAGMIGLVEEDGYTFFVTEVAGGGHSTHSRHYVGVAFDVGVLNGARVSATNPAVTGFREACSRLGATEVLGPGDLNHDTHVHAAWPRPAALARSPSAKTSSDPAERNSRLRPRRRVP